MDSEWEVTKAAFNGLKEPYAVVKPYSTWESAASLLVHRMVAELAPMPEEDTALMTGARLSTVIAMPAEVVLLPAASLATAVTACAPLE